MGRRTTTDKLSDLNREVGEVKEARKTQDLRLDKLTRQIAWLQRGLMLLFALLLGNGVSMKTSGEDVIGALVNAVVAVAEAVQAVVSAAG